MSHFLTDRPQLWHGNLMKLILTVGLLSILAVSEIKAQSIMTVYSKSASKVKGMTTRAQDEGVCTQTHTRMHQSECEPCVLSGDPCQPGSSLVVIQHCPYDGYGQNTCRFMCAEEYTTEYCCQGFWGHNCTEECPGGHGNPCNGHGNCSNQTGQCDCEPGFEGTACELCTDETKYGPNCSLEAGMTTPAQAKNSCKRTLKRTYHTKCAPCNLPLHPCGPRGVLVRTHPCSNIWSCRVICEEEYTEESCCHGFWGDGCILDCPGGSGNPCNGHGECSSQHGQCVCEAGFEGKACELCTDVTKYGPNCSLDCKCEDGECNNGIHGDGLCAGENPCQSPVPPCGNNRQCIHTGPGRHRCACHDGYAEHGTKCAPINPCQNNRGDCDATTDCIYTGPNQHKCQCMDGYEGDNPDKGCTIKDMCSPGICGPNAVCKTREPLKHSCVCKKGYIWDGTRCQGNIIKAQCTLTQEGERKCTCPKFMVGYGIACRRRTIAEEIMENPKLARLRQIVKIVNASNNILDVINTSYTFFAPDRRSIMKKFKKHKKSLEYWSQEENALSFLKFHTIKHSFSTDDLMASDAVIQSYPTLYDGYTLHIENIDQNLQIYSRHSRPAVVKKADISAVNGYIHIINQVMVPSIPNSQESPSLTTLLSSKPKYKLFYEALQKTNVLETLSALKEYTLFVFPNDAVPHMTMNITADFLKYHILPQRVSTNAMLDKTEKDTILGSRYRLSVKKLRRKIYVNGVKITRPDMWTDVGVIHEVPEFLRSVNNRCDLTISGAAVKTECCGGYYGPDCDRCPGGPDIPCSGNGVCDDGVSGSGKCKCNPGFSGELCEIF